MEIIRQFDIWLANLNPQKGTEMGKTRPVVIIQANLLNDNMPPSTIICPITTNVLPVEIIRVHLNQNQLDKLSDIVVEQIRTIDNKRLLKKIGRLTKEQREKLKENLRIVLDL